MQIVLSTLMSAARPTAAFAAGALSQAGGVVAAAD